MIAPAPSVPVSRRTLLLAAGAAAVVVACGDDDERTTISSTAPDTTSGPSTIDPSGVVVLDEIAALSVLSLGIVPRSVDATFGYRTVTSICEALGITVHPGSRSVEDVLADDPTTVIGVSIPTFVEASEQIGAVVPAIVVDFAATWQQQLNQVASALGAEASARALAGRLDESIAALGADLTAAGLDGRTVSVLAGSTDGPFALSRTGLVGQVLAELGLGRPAPQDVDTESTTPFITISEEVLGAHDADTIVRLTGPGYPIDTLESSPLWPQLGAVRSGAVHDVVAEIWFAASAFSLAWILDDLRAVLLEEGVVGTADDAVSRFESFLDGG